MLKPTLKRNSNGSFPNDFCRLICLYWAEEDEWNGDTVSAAKWKKEFLSYDRAEKLGITGCDSNTKVTDSRLREGNFVWRRRRCLSCSHPFTTNELMEGLLSRPVKRPAKVKRIDELTDQELEAAIFNGEFVDE